MFRQHRPLTMFALACALFLRVWVPAGWMPAANGTPFAIEPCAASAPQPLAHAQNAHHGGPHKGQHNGQHEGYCAFAPLQAGFAAAAQAPQLIAPALAPTPLPEQFAVPFLATGPPSPPPPATGPPAIA